jgi:hypothetical protein
MLEDLEPNDIDGDFAHQATVLGNSVISTIRSGWWRRLQIKAAARDPHRLVDAALETERRLCLRR